MKRNEKKMLVKIDIIYTEGGRGLRTKHVVADNKVIQSNSLVHRPRVHSHGPIGENSSRGGVEEAKSIRVAAGQELRHRVTLARGEA